MNTELSHRGGLFLEVIACGVVVVVFSISISLLISDLRGNKSENSYYMVTAHDGTKIKLKRLRSVGSYLWGEKFDGNTVHIGGNFICEEIVEKEKSE
jgi:hypothetical protein